MNAIFTNQPKNVMNHLGETVVINNILYNLPTAEDLACADLREGWSVSNKVKEQMTKEV